MGKIFHPGGASGLHYFDENVDGLDLDMYYSWNGTGAFSHNK